MRKLLVVSAILAVALPASAGWTKLEGEDAPALEIESWIAAPECANVPDLEGRVILLLLGGAAEDQVAALNDMRAAYFESGLRIVRLIAEEPADPEALLADVGVEFCVAVGRHSAYGDGDAPRAILIAADGEVEWEGAPSHLDEADLAALLRKTKEFEIRKVTPDVKDAASAFSKGQLAEARELANALLLAEGAGDEVILDADHVRVRVGAMLSYWQQQAARAESRGDVAEAAVWLERIEKRFSGAEEGDAAKEALAVLEDGADFKKEVSAAARYVKFRSDFVRAGDNERKIASAVKKMERYLDRNPGTRGAARIARLLGSLKEDPALVAILEFIAREKIDNQGSGWREKLEKPPQVEFVPGKSYFWNLETNQGSMKLKFLPDEAPMHVSSTIYLTLLGFYDGLTFHRVIPGFMAQGGCPKGSGTGGPGYQYDGEFGGPSKHSKAGTLSMAHSGPGTDGSQFFITFGPTPGLDGKHTVFGYLVGGQATLDKLEGMGTDGGRPTGKLEIRKATVTVE